MIVDITNEILTDLKTTITDAKVLSSYQPTTTSFPVIVCEETDNVSDDNTKDSSGFTHCKITLSVEIYTNGPNRMSNAKTLRGAVDSILSDKYGLSRISQRPIPNFNDSDIYRYQISYVGSVDKNKKIFRR